MMSKPKFNLGDAVFYVDASCNYGTKVPCPICFGKLRVAVILGNDERVYTECGHCAPGMERPSGVATTWGVHAAIVEGTITGIRQDYGSWKYEVSGRNVDGHEIFRTREEAEPVREAKLKEVTEQKRNWERDSFVTATKKQLWSAGYHRSQIRYHERHIDWHKARLCMISEKASDTTGRADDANPT